MPVLPEKSNRARSAVHAQFWDQTDHSPRSIDGVAWKLPCEPTSMPLSAPSGISRSQQLIAAQTLGVPALPSYDEHSGGLVLDRNVLKVGGESWWSAVSCRVKTQKMYSDSAAKKAFQSSEISDWLKPLAVSSNYGLLSRTHAKAGPVIFDSTIEALDAGALSMAFRHNGSDGQPQLVPNVLKLGEALATHSSVRMDVHGHSIGASLATNLDVGDCGGEYARVPKALSLDISTTTSQDGLQYRAGVHQVTAPSLDGSYGGNKAGRRTSLHAQGAVAVEGEAYVWKPRPRGSASKPTGAGVSGKAAPSTSGKSAVAVKTGGAAGGTGDTSDGANPASHGQIEEFVSNLGDGNPRDDGEQCDDEESSMSGAQVSIPSPLTAEDVQPTDITENVEETRCRKPRILPVTSTSISASISDSLKSLESIRSNVSKLTDDVHEGALQRFVSGAGKRDAARARPYSFLLSQPHIKLVASLGCLARMPLPNGFGLVGWGNGAVTNGSGMTENGHAIDAPLLSNMGSLSRHLNASTASLISKSSLSSQLADAWEPYLKRTTIRVFSSIGVSAQMGKFTRRFLDYSAIEVKLDLGLNSQHVVGSLPTTNAMSAIDIESRPDKNRAFALEGKGVWHCCTISAAQQVFGPLRAKADFRFALDPTNVPQNQGDSRTLKGIAQTALSIRPCLLESVFGGDVLIPGTEGAARISCFWAPKKGEGMVELRLF